MLKKCILNITIFLVLILNIPCFVIADEYNDNVKVESIAISDVSFDIPEAESDYSQAALKEMKEVYSPVNISVDIDGDLKSIELKNSSHESYNIYIVYGEEILLYYDSSIFDTDNESINMDINQVTLSEGKRYYISVNLKDDNLIESYDGYFGVQGTEIVYEYIYHSIAEIDAINDILQTRATQYESEGNNNQGTADVLGEGNSIYGKISTQTDVDWYKVEFSRDGFATFSMTNIPAATNYDMAIYVADSQYSVPALIYTCRNTSNVSELYRWLVSSDKCYYVQVFSSQNYNSSLNYKVSVENDPVTDQYEINDSISTAEAINVGSTYYANIHDSDDVDYYKITFAGGILTANLSNIPSGTNYDLDLCNSSGTRLTYSHKSGTNEENLVYSLSSGTYYLKVFSASGASYTNNYKLSTVVRPSSINLTCTFDPVIPANASIVNGTTTYIEDLPVEIFTVTNLGYESKVASGITNSSGVFSKNGINIGTNIEALRVKVKFENSVLSIQNNSATVYTYTYDIPIGNSANISVSIPNSYSVLDEQIFAYASWKNGIDCIDLHNAISSTNLGKIVIRGETGYTQGTSCTGTSYIKLNGNSTDKDYLDKDILLHEMGHWLVSKLNASPSNATGSHSYNTYGTNGLALSEGFATFYSCVARNSAEMMDYNYLQSDYGINLSNAKYYQSYSWREFPLHTTNHSMNQMNELNAGNVLWAYKNQESYSAVQSLLTDYPKKNSMQEMYEAAIENASATEKEIIWNIFNNRGCAFDLTLPTVTLTTLSGSVKVSATDNISVEKIEWYVNGNLVQSKTNVTTDVLNLTEYTGNVTVEVRVYDPEGLAENPRPRTERYTSKVVVVNCGSRNTTLANEQIFHLDEYVEYNTKSVFDKEITLLMGEKQSYSVYMDGYEDLYVYAHIVGGIEGLNIYNPEGKLFDYVEYISPDTPYVIRNAKEGKWTIEFVALTRENLFSLGNNTGNKSSTSISLEENDMLESDEMISSKIVFKMVKKPTSIIINETIYTNNPSVLLDVLLTEKGANVYSSGKKIDYLQPLSDGEYNLELIRTIDGTDSNSTYLHLVIDTAPPEVTFVNDLETCEEGIYLHGLCSTDTVEVMLDDEYLCLSDDTDFGIYLELDEGICNKKLVLRDKCGNSTEMLLTLKKVLQ